MKNLTFAALLVVSGAAFAQTIIQDDFETVPSASNDGRDGWRHNFNRPGDNYSSPLNQGDKSSRVLWKDFAGNGAILGHEAGAGQGDWWIAADKFIVNGGDFTTLASAQFEFKIARISPLAVTAASTTVATQSLVTVRFYNAAGSGVEKIFRNSDFPTNFWSVAGIGVPTNLALDLKNSADWIAVAGGTYETVMNQVTQIAIDFELVSGAEQTALDDAKLTYDAGAGTQVILSDFNTPPVLESDGRAGWTHNGPLDNFIGFPQGDIGGIAYWSSESIDNLQSGFVTTGMLLVGDPAQGNTDNAVAPARYRVLDGRFDMMATGAFTFDFVRFLPTSNVSSSSYSPLDALVVSTGEGYIARYRISNDELSALNFWGAINFWQTPGLNLAWPIAVDINNKSKWIVSRPSGAPIKSLEEIMANVEYVSVDGEIRSGTETNGFDNFKLEFAERAKINGSMEFGDRIDQFPSGSLVQFLDPSTGTVSYQAWAKRATDGTYVLPQAVPGGTFDLVSDPGLLFLRARINGVNNPGTDVNGINFNFVNGDVDGSGEVDAADIDAVIAAFGNAVGGPDPYAANEDVDGSGEVDAADIDIVISKFGEVDA